MGPRALPDEYWEHRLAHHPGLGGVGYLGLGSAYNTWVYRLRGRVVRRLVREFQLTADGSSVLDVGSGTGHYVRLWKDVGVRDLVASDIAPVAVRRLRRAFPDCRVVHLDVGGPELPPSLSDFGLVSAFDVLFHIVDDERYRMALSNVARLLEPGGWFLFSENFVRGETQRFEHQVTRSRAEIEAAVNDAGFDIITRRPMMAVMNAPVDSRRRFLRFAWKVMTSPARIHDSLGWALGAVLFPVDLTLTRLFREGPSTDVCLCRKRSN